MQLTLVPRILQEIINYVTEKQQPWAEIQSLSHVKKFFFKIFEESVSSWARKQNQKSTEKQNFDH